MQVAAASFLPVSDPVSTIHRIQLPAEALAPLKAATLREKISRNLPAHLRVMWGYWQASSEAAGPIDLMIVPTQAGRLFECTDLGIVSARDLRLGLRVIIGEMTQDQLFGILFEAVACAADHQSHEPLSYGWVQPKGKGLSHSTLTDWIHNLGAEEFQVAEMEDSSSPEIWIMESDSHGKWLLKGMSEHTLVDHVLTWAPKGQDQDQPQTRTQVAIIPLKTAITVSDTKDVEGRNALHHAVIANDVKKVANLLGQGYSPDTCDYSFNTSLHLAAEINADACMKLLLDHGGEWKAKNNKGKTALHEAASHGSNETLVMLLEHGADPNATMDKDITPVHLASWQGHIRVVHELARFGANVNSQNDDGNAAIHFASGNNQVKMIKKLITLGADPHLKNSLGLSYLEIVNEGYSGRLIQVMG